MGFYFRSFHCKLLHFQGEIRTKNMVTLWLSLIYTQTHSNVWWDSFCRAHKRIHNLTKSMGNNCLSPFRSHPCNDSVISPRFIRTQLVYIRMLYRHKRNLHIKSSKRENQLNKLNTSIWINVHLLWQLDSLKLVPCNLIYDRIFWITERWRLWMNARFTPNLRRWKISGKSKGIRGY